MGILIAILFGAFSGGMVTHQDAYCKCYRTNFDGVYCKSIKGDGSQGSCHK